MKSDKPEAQINQEFNEMVIRVLGEEAVDDQPPIPNRSGNRIYYQDPGYVEAFVYPERTLEEERLVPTFALRAVESVMKRAASSEM